MVKIALILILLATGAFVSTEEMCFALLRAGDYARAIQLGHELIRRNPGSYNAHGCLSKAYYETGNFEASLRHAEKMEKLGRTPFELYLAYSRLGLAYAKVQFFSWDRVSNSPT